jgi:hypothetical protein
MRVACQQGLPDVRGALDAPDPMRSEADERRFWKSRDVSAESPHHPAQLPMELSADAAHEQGLVRMTKNGAQTYVNPAAVASHVASGWAAET